MKPNLHLSFAGNCREAFDFYAKTLNGKIELAMTYGESPMAEQCGPADKDLIMHTALQLENMVLMGADAPPGRFQKPQGFSIALGPKTLAESERVFAALSAGGEVVMPMQKTFWSPGFGMLVDRFGIPWMVSTDDA